MKKLILFSVLVVGATLLQAQSISITVHQTCGQNGQVLVIETNGHKFVDLGLPSGTLWATCNVGAESPEDYGNYYAWGETSTKETYSFDTYFDTNDDGHTFAKYNNEGGKTVLDPEDDAAHVNWSGSWRMPTKAECEELIDNCTWTWTTQNGINGYKVTSNKAGYTDKFIFLPAAGYHSLSGLRIVGSYGSYWSSSLYEYRSNNAWHLAFNSDYHGFERSRSSGRSVRPVLQPSSISYNSSSNDTIRIYSNGCDDYQTFIGSHGSQLTMTANSDQWSHFVRWNDGNTDNPRTITTNGNADYTAYFETYKYSVQVQSNDAARGRGYISKVVKESTMEYNESVGTFDAGSEVFFTYQANYGYHFIEWSDGNISQQRSFILTQDTTFTATFAKNVYSITKNAEHGTISGNSSAEYLDQVTLSVSSDYGYHFTQWSDGNTDNPRTIVLTKDTTFTAEFAKNNYTISTTSANPEWGTTAGDTTALYLDEVEISAIPNYGYHFVHWNDNNGSNPRTVSVTEDKTYTATFAKNVYSITKNAEHGTISGNSSAEYLDFVTLTVTPDYGYHFTQWSDGLKDNPRIFQITQDTTFTAEFAYDRVGTCGKDMALVWSYDPSSKVLTIGNAGEFTENMQFGVEAPNEMEELVIGNSVTAIGANAFAGIETLKKVSIGESVKTIGEQAFYNCVNLETIFNYRPTPTNTYSNAFDGVDKFECVLYVLPSSIDMYKNASVWRDFYYTYAIGAEETTVTTNDVTVEPQDNAATVTWPTSENAATYTIQITKDGVVSCTLIFNSNGQLTGIAFAPGRNGNRHAPQAVMTPKGLQFTVTGLNSATHYALTLQAKDDQDAVLASYSSEFTTTGTATAVDYVPGDQVQCTKILRDGQILILRCDKTYTLQGQEVK